MPIQVEVPGQGLVEFPDGMSDDDISNVIRSQMGAQQEKPYSNNPFNAEFYNDMSLKNVPQNLANLGAGALRGAGSIGATALLPADMINQKLRGEDFFSLKDNDARRAAMDAGLQTMGADPKSGLYQTGKFGTELAGTAGAGDVLALGAAAAKLPKLANALKSGGFNLGEKAATDLPIKQAIAQALERGGTRVAGGAMAGGAQAGMISPEDAGTGVLIGGALPVAVKGAYGIGKGATGAAKSLIDPLYEGGREKILGNALRNAAGNQADNALVNLQYPPNLVPGSQPTAGMASGSPGIAALERAAMSNNPIATNELALRQAANSEARNSALEGLIPNREISKQARTDATQELYKSAMDAKVDITPELKNLIERPSLKNAISRAQQLAKEKGEPLIVGKDIPASIIESDILQESGKPFTVETQAELANMSGRAAQYLKMALDDMTNSAPMTGISGNELRSIQATRQSYLDELGKQIPAYLKANKDYAALSAPLTQADVLSEVKNKGTDFRGNLTPAAFVRALSDKTAQSATGKATASMESTLSPSQLAVLKNIKQDLLNQDFANTAGRGVGSNTVQNLANSNMVESFGIPTALRNSTVGGVVGGVLSRGSDVVYGKANKQLSQELAEALLDPRKAAQVMQKASKPTKEGEKYKLLAKALSRSAPVLATHE